MKQGAYPTKPAAPSLYTRPVAAMGIAAPPPTPPDQKPVLNLDCMAGCLEEFDRLNHVLGDRLSSVRSLADTLVGAKPEANGEPNPPGAGCIVVRFADGLRRMSNMLEAMEQERQRIYGGFEGQF